MDLKRSFLLAGVLISAFLLWTTWQQEHPREVTPAEIARTVSAEQDNLQASTGMEEGAEQAKADIPPISSAAFSSVAQDAREIPASSLYSSRENESITVTTDVLSLKIDPLGGNIIKAELLKYKKDLDQNSAPVQILNSSPESLYVAQSGLAGAMGPDSPERGQALYRAAERSYELSGDTLVVPMVYEENGLRVTKEFVLKRGEYTIGVRYRIDNQMPSPWVGQFYGQIKRAEPASVSSPWMSFSTYNGAAISTPEKRYQKISYSDMADETLSLNTEEGWIAMQQHYFLTAWIPTKGQSYQFKTFAPVDNIYRIAMLGPVLQVLPGQTLETGATFVVAPEDTSMLKHIAPSLELTIDYGWFWPISQGLFWLMDQFYHLLGNWGLAIILVTILIKALFYKLSESSYRSMAYMRKVQPKIEKLKEKYGEDKQKFSQAIMELYKTEKINPLGGCLPILVQIPVFIALYWVLIESVELRHAPFFGWIQDLSARDPYYILPLIMGATMLVQQKLSPEPPDPTQAKVMMLMPIFFTALFLSFPAGLVLYWTVNNILSIAQQWWVTSRIK